MVFKAFGWLLFSSSLLAQSPCEQAVKQGSYAEALPVCEKALQDEGIEPIEIWLYLVEIHHKLGQEEQEAFYLAKIKTDPQFIENLDYQYKWTRRVGQRYYFLDEFEKADRFLQQGLKMALSEQNQLWQSMSFNDVGLVAYKLNKHLEALSYYQQSLTLKLASGDIYSAAKTLNNIALVQMNLEQYDQAIDYYEQALEQYLAYTHETDFDERVFQHISHIFEDLTKAYAANGNTLKAAEYAQKIIATFKTKESPRSQARALVNIAKSHLSKEQYPLAKRLYDEAKQIHDQQGFAFNPEFCLDYAVVNFHMGELAQAINWAEEGLALASQQNNARLISQFYALLSEYQKGDNLALAYQRLKQYQTSREAFLKAKYDQDLNNIQHEIEKQNIQHELINEQLGHAQKAAELQRLTNAVLLAAILLMLLAGLLLLYLIKRKKERQALLQSIKHHEQQLFLMQSQGLQLNDPQTANSVDLKHEFKVLLVNTMIEALSVWEKATQTNRIELAEQSAVWTVSVDSGTLRTRSLDKYLELEKMPDNPRWRNVAKTCHFILTRDELSGADRQLLEQRLEAIMQMVKQISLSQKN